MSYSSRRVAARRQAWSASQAAFPLWRLSKRELIEIALHLGALCTEVDYDAALENGQAVARVQEEVRTLRKNGLI